MLICDPPACLLELSMISSLRRKPMQFCYGYAVALILCCLPWSLAFAQSVVGSVPVGMGPEEVGVNPVTNRIYVTDRGSSDVSVIDGETNQVIATAPTGMSPIGIAVNPVTNKVDAAGVLGGTVTVIEPAPCGADAIAVAADHGSPSWAPRFGESHPSASTSR
jgi:YVTN family beta-propeller protein